jgi:broad specificity phosphatase PhoE
LNIYITRHGETDWNSKWKLQGRTDIPLNEQGIRQAFLTAEGLKSEGIIFDRVYSSPLSRAVKTASILSGLPEDNIIKDDRLIELSFGKAEGSTPDERNTKQEFIQINNFFNDPENYRPDDGSETFESALERTADFWESELKPLERTAQNILVTTHGGALQSLLLHVDGRSLKDYWKVRFPNCSINLVTLKNGIFQVEWTGRTFYKAEPTRFSGLK